MSDGGGELRLTARVAAVAIVGLAMVAASLPTTVSASPPDARWVFRHTETSGPAPWDKGWTLKRDLTLPVLKGAGVRDRSVVARWVRAQLSERLESLGLFYLDNKRGGCSPERFPDRISSTTKGTVIARRFSTVSIKFWTSEGCLGGSMSFYWSDTATWDLRTHRQLTLADVVDLAHGWSPEPALTAAINALPDDCLFGPLDADALERDTTPPFLRDRWTLGKRGLIFHMNGEEANTAKWCEGPELLLTWDQLPLTALGKSIASHV